ncbi:response regulator transcription factor [Streptosporangium sp. NPDC048047]|uniref:response regulator transcription factor n=1 Tax=Streptosporangium sp. NPDC048047 TaxID=3155748 RepID=UPI00344199F2
MADGAQVQAAVGEHSPDVVLMDIRMAGVDGIDATRRLRARQDAPEVIILTTFDVDEHVFRALRAGAGGFLLKDTPPEGIVEAIRRVVAGEPSLSPSVTRRLIDRLLPEEDDHRRADARRVLATLSDREREVALAVGQGKTNAVIAGELHMSVGTVKGYISRILTKSGLDNRVQLALVVHDASWDDPPLIAAVTRTAAMSGGPGRWPAAVRYAGVSVRSAAARASTRPRARADRIGSM